MINVIKLEINVECKVTVLLTVVEKVTEKTSLTPPVFLKKSFGDSLLSYALP